VVLTRCDPGDPFPAVLDRYAVGAPVFRSVHDPYPHLFLTAGQPPSAAPSADPSAGPSAGPSTGPGGDTAWLSGRRVFGVSGIARNDAFRETLRRLGADLAGFRGFPDHHRYTGADIGSILAAARQQGADLLATTEKDWVRLSDRSPWPLDLLVVGVRFDPGPDGGPLVRLVEAHLGSGSRL
jgi:tetraacyldisaccharide 4'-kinase